MSMLFFLWFPLCRGEAGLVYMVIRCMATFVTRFHWSLLVAFSLHFSSSYTFSDLSSHDLKPTTDMPCVRAFLRKSPQLEDAGTHRSTFSARRFRTIAAFPINSERLDAFTSKLPEIGRRSRICATRATEVISERKHCSTYVDAIRT